MAARKKSGVSTPAPKTIAMPEATVAEFKMLMWLLGDDPVQTSPAFNRGIKMDYLKKLRKIPWPAP